MALSMSVKTIPIPISDCLGDSPGDDDVLADAIKQLAGISLHRRSLTEYYRVYDRVFARRSGSYEPMDWGHTLKICHASLDNSAQQKLHRITTE